jgi:peptidoglycan-associated lipoprotein
MTIPSKLAPLMAAALLIGAGLACRKPAPAPAPQAEPPLADTSAEDKARAEEEARRRAQEEEARRRAEAAAEEARRVAALEAEFLRAAQAALQDVHFNFDQAEILEHEKNLLAALADFMKQYPKAKLSIEGHCDERGTVEYNLALGERRAHAVLDYLKGLGVAEERLGAISFGKEKPLCQESQEACWSRNRRAHFELVR